jgi:hypothetical protein
VRVCSEAARCRGAARRCLLNSHLAASLRAEAVMRAGAGPRELRTAGRWRRPNSARPVAAAPSHSGQFTALTFTKARTETRARRGAALACGRAAGEVLRWARPRPKCVFVLRHAAVSKTARPPAKAQSETLVMRPASEAGGRALGKNARRARGPHPSPRKGRALPVRNASRSASVRAPPYEHFCTLGRSFALPARLCAPGRKRHASTIYRQGGSESVVLWCNG